MTMRATCQVKNPLSSIQLVFGWRHADSQLLRLGHEHFGNGPPRCRWTGATGLARGRYNAEMGRLMSVSFIGETSWGTASL